MVIDENSFISVLSHIKSGYESCVTSASFDGRTYPNGQKAKEALIRSSRLIGYIHEFIKEELISRNIAPTKIYPPLGQSNPEIPLTGFLKKKKQDICVIPDMSSRAPENLSTGPLRGTPDPLGKNLAERSLSINIRSQLSSLGKNFDTLYERTFAEALNLHLRNPRTCLGEVYLIPTHEYDDSSMLTNRIAFKPKPSDLEKYIYSFQAINSRTDHTKDDYKYERVFLAIADFRSSPPKLYSEIEDLIRDHLVPEDTTASLEELSVPNFIDSLLERYSERFDINALS